MQSALRGVLLTALIACSSAGSPADRVEESPAQAGGAAPTAGAGSTGGAARAAASAGGAGSGGVLQQAGSGALAGAGQPGTGGAQAELPPAGVPPSYRLVFEQSFAEASSLNELLFANPSEWRHDPSGFVESTGFSYDPPYRSPFSLAIVKSIVVQSFVMDVELLQTSPDGDAHRDMCLIWNLVSPSRFYYAHISTAHDAVAHNIHIVNDADRTSISTSFTPGYDWGREIWKRLRVVRDVESGSTQIFDLEAPDQAILTASDSTFTEGYIGFGSFDNTGRVRNLKVWAEAAATGAPAFFSSAE
jgi:hypothetical protein